MKRFCSVVFAQQFLLIALMAVPLISLKAFATTQGKIALVQYNGDRALERYENYPMTKHWVGKIWRGNISALKSLADSAVKQGANIIVLPEGSTYGYSTAKSVWCRNGYPYLKDHRLHQFQGTTEGAFKYCLPAEEIVEEFPSLDTNGNLTVGGRTTQFWADYAKKNNVYVIYSVPEIGLAQNDSSASVEKDGSMLYFSTLGVVGPKGYVTKYRKRVTYITDQMFAVPGRNPAVVETEFGSFGLMVCIDAFDNSKFGVSLAQPGGHKYDFGFYDLYKIRGIKQVIVSMDWDHDPLDDTDLPDTSSATQAAREASSAGDSSAVSTMEMQGRDQGVTIYVSDNSKYDGTGMYIPNQKRVRSGMPQYSPGNAADGVVIVPIQ